MRDRTKRQPPVYSPISIRSLAIGCVGAFGRGDPLREVRRLLTREYSCRAVLLADSGTTALALAMRGAMQLSGSRSVAIPNFCCFDIGTAAVSADCEVALYDVQPDTLGPNFVSLRAAFEAGARTAVVVHLFGFPVDLDQCRGLCDEYDAVMIEDAAQGAGGEWYERPLGSSGDVGVLSFGRGKGRTGGGGGALLANDKTGEDLIKVIEDVPLAGGRGLGGLVKLAGQLVFGRPPLYAIAAAIPMLKLGETRYKEPWPPRGMDRGTAAALAANWTLAQHESEVRRDRARVCSSRVAADQTLRAPQSPAPGRPGYLRYPVIVNNDSTHEIDGVPGVGPSYPAEIRLLPALKGRVMYATGGTGTRFLIERLRTLPTHRWAIKDTPK